MRALKIQKQYIIFLTFLLLILYLIIVTKGSHFQEPSRVQNEDVSSEQVPAWYHERYYYPMTSQEVARKRYEYLKQTGSLKNLATQQKTNQLGKRTSNEWENIGPFGLSTCPTSSGRNDINFSGRIISLAQDFGNPNVMYLGAASGGLWKSTDRGASWKNILDDLAHPSVSSIATNPGTPGDVWIGTGNKGNGFGSDGAPSMGLVYHSADFGEHWELVNISENFIGFVSKIIVRPAPKIDMTDVVIISTDNGVFRSENGVDWIQVLYGSFSDVVYVGSVFGLDYKVVAAEFFGSKLWYSDDKGLTGSWSSRSLPGSAATLGRISLSASVLGLNTKVYAIVAAANSTLDGVYRSDDGGDNWRKMTNPFTPGGQMNYNNTILMDDEISGLIVYTGTSSREIWRSVDGGVSWTTSYDDSMGVIHEDQHFILDDVQRSGTIYVANDGGLYKSADRGESFTFLGNQFLSIAQIYHLTVSPESGGLYEGKRYYIGTQDNGVQRGPNEFLQWQALTCCDGGDIAFKDGLFYSTIVLGNSASANRIQVPPDENPCQRWNGFTTGLPTGEMWGSQIINNGNHFYLSFTRQLWRADNGTMPWRLLQDFAGFTGSRIDRIAVTPENVVITGINNPYPVRISDADNTNFITVPANDQAFYDGKRVTDIDIGSTTSTGRRIYVTLSGISGRRIIMSRNTGQNFIDITGDLPDLINARSILVDPFDNNIIYVGSDLGVFVTTNSGLNWTNHSDKLPAACYVTDLEYDTHSHKIVAATYGRGVFITDPLYSLTLDVSTVHVATPSTITSSWTTIEHPLIDNTPDAIIMVTQNWNPGGVVATYNNRPIGVRYDSGAGRWAVFNQDQANMTTGTAFNLFLPDSNANAFTHTATSENLVQNYTHIDHYLTNNNPDATVFITQNWNPGGVGGIYNNHPIGVWYDSKVGKWAVFNQDMAAIPEGAGFNVFISDAKDVAFAHTATSNNRFGNSTYIDHSLTNNNPDAIIMITQNWNPGGKGGTYNNHPIGVWYEANENKWAIFNQDMSEMPEGAAFNVYIPGEQLPTSLSKMDRVPVSFQLDQNFPNPFKLRTTISYNLLRQSHVELAIFNMTGQKVASLVFGQQVAGSYQYEWDVEDDMASGVYFYRLTVGRQFVQTRKLMLMK